MNKDMDNIDSRSVQGFGEEWRRYDQSDLSEDELNRIFEDYFHLVPWGNFGADLVAADLGCGSGRWARFVSPKVGCLHLVDASTMALEVAQKKMSDSGNVQFHLASVSTLPFESDSLDFAYSLGVLHHVPDIGRAVDEIHRVLKPSGLFLAYIYYAFENRGSLFKLIWRVSDLVRRLVCVLPFRAKALVADLIAITVYWPMSRIAQALDRVAALPSGWPLSYQRDKSLYTLRTDCLDRFGTSLENRYTAKEIHCLLTDHGFENVKFSSREPHWCVIAQKK